MVWHSQTPTAIHIHFLSQFYIHVFFFCKEKLINTQIFLDEKKIKNHSNHNFSNLALDGYSYDNWCGKPNDKEMNDIFESDENVSPIPPLQGGKEVKEGGRIKILTPSKQLTRRDVQYL